MLIFFNQDFVSNTSQPINAILFCFSIENVFKRNQNQLVHHKIWTILILFCHYFTEYTWTKLEKFLVRDWFSVFLYATSESILMDYSKLQRLCNIGMPHSSILSRNYYFYYRVKTQHKIRFRCIKNIYTIYMNIIQLRFVFLQ